MRLVFIYKEEAVGANFYNLEGTTNSFFNYQLPSLICKWITLLTARGCHKKGGIC